MSGPQTIHSSCLLLVPGTGVRSFSEVLPHGGYGSENTDRDPLFNKNLKIVFFTQFLKHFRMFLLTYLSTNQSYRIRIQYK